MADRRVVVVSQEPPPVHGSTVMTVRLRAALRTAGYDPVLVDRRFSRSVEHVGRASLGKVLAVPSLLARVAAAAHAGEPVVYFLTDRPGSFAVDALALALVRLRRARPVLYLHTSGYGRLAARGRLWRAAVRRVLGAADRVVVLGPALAEEVARLAPQGRRVESIPNTAPDPGEPADHPADGRFRLLFLSNLLPEKGVGDFVALAEDLLGDGAADWRFAVAGDGSPEQLADVRARAVALGPGRVVVHGAVHGADRDRLLQEADVLVFPSRYPLEAQPLVVVEALAAGLPVVAYGIGGLADVVGGATGALVPAGDRAALAAAVTALRGDPGRLAGARSASRARWTAEHAPEVYRERWQRLLEGLEGVRP